MASVAEAWASAASEAWYKVTRPFGWKASGAPIRSWPGGALERVTFLHPLAGVKGRAALQPLGSVAP
jgi:hypothetical protein